MSFFPNFSSLSLVRPTGAPGAQTRARRAAMDRLWAQATVLGNNDLLVRILTALNEGSLDDTCELAVRWCATQREGCNDETWQALIALVFPNEGENAQRPKAKFTELCMRWDRGRKAEYAELLAKRKARYPGRTPNGAADFEAMAKFLRAEYAYEVPRGLGDDDDDPRTWTHFFALDLEEVVRDVAAWFGWTVTPELQETIGVSAFLIKGVQHHPQMIVWLIEAGYVHVSDVFPMPPQRQLDNFIRLLSPPDGSSAQALTADCVAFSLPDTLLGMALRYEPRLNADFLMRKLLAFGADPNASIWRATWLAYSRGITVAEDDLHFDDEGAAENMAFWHIIKVLVSKVSSGWDPCQVETKVPENWYVERVPLHDGTPKDFLGQMPRHLIGFRALVDYGGDIYGAAAMYDVYAQHFNERMFLEMARREPPHSPSFAES